MTPTPSEPQKEEGIGTAHTPGPWKLDDHPRREYPRVTDHLGRFVADCLEVDARLIAAAPDLLAALQLAVRQNSHDMLMTGEELRKCSAAIAKAGGTQ